MANDSARQLDGSWYTTFNPLLEGLPRFESIDDLNDKLAFNPLEGIDIANMGLMDRHALLVGEKTPLEPTFQCVRTAMTALGMFNTSLRVRNPVLPEARRIYWAAINAASRGDALPLTPSIGMSILVVLGPTGTGKTVTKQRICSLLPQVVVRDRCEAAGWAGEFRQLVFLDINISPDGTRGAFVIDILLQMDAILGTNYARDQPRQFKTVDKLIIAMIGRLIAHFTGMIFIDEGQLRNLVKSGQADLMQLLLLSLMNSGIPIVFIGNEMAFDWVTFSQDKTRLYMNPKERFAPIGAIDHPYVEDEWAALATGIMNYYLLHQPVTHFEGCSKVLRKCSGGDARMALTLWCSGQVDNLLKGIETIGPEDIQRAYDAETFSDLRPLAEGFAFRKPELLLGYPDVDAYFYAQHWGVPIPDKVPNGSTPDNSSSKQTSSPKKETNGTSKPTQHQSGKQKFAAEQTRNSKKQEERNALNKSLSPEDIRKQGLINVQLAGLAASRAKAEKMTEK